jgi:hypothetical protein
MFIRWGGLAPVRQRGFKLHKQGDIGYHTPPARKGIYAFPWPHIEPFLLGAECTTSKTDFKLKDSKGRPITKEDNPDVFEKMLKQSDYNYEHEQNGKTYIKKRKALRPKKFNYRGDVWHHLECRSIKKSKGDWFLSDFGSYVQALEKEIHKTKSFKHNTGWNTSKDHFEVFLERP